LAAARGRGFAAVFRAGAFFFAGDLLRVFVAIVVAL
jgi:hypothetical protein